MGGGFGVLGTQLFGIRGVAEYNPLDRVGGGVFICPKVLVSGGMIDLAPIIGAWVTRLLCCCRVL